MKTIDIGDALNNFIGDDNKKSILIDGPWGSGKTYEINNFIKNQKNHKNIVYCSFFGMDSIDRINEYLFSIEHKHSIFVKNGIIVFSKVVSAFPKMPDISEGLNYCLGNNKKKLKKKRIIIFDDLERLSPLLSFSDMLGFINSLFLLECKVICCVSSINIGDEKRKDDFDDFREKVFDYLLTIEESPSEIFNEIFKDVKLENISDLYYLFDSNIRFAKRTHGIYETITQRIKSKKFSNEDILEKEIFISCIIVILICFKKNKNIVVNGEDKIGYEVSIEYNGKILTDGIIAYKNDTKTKDFFNFFRFRDLTISIGKILLFNNYNDFDSIFFTEIDGVKDNDDILLRNFYFLSDTNKEKYIFKVNKLIISNNFKWDSYFQNCFRVAILSNNYILPDSGTYIIANKIIEENGADYGSELDSFIIGEKIDKFANYMIILDKIRNECEIIWTKSIFDKINELFSKRNYSQMKKEVLNIQTYGDKIIKQAVSFFEENNYFLPDLSADITAEEWNYCHVICKFIAEHGGKDNFINKIINITHDNKNNNSLVERFYDLIFFEIDKDFNKSLLIS